MIEHKRIRHRKSSFETRKNEYYRRLKKIDEYQHGWSNLIGIIAVLSIIRHITNNFVEFGLIMKIPLSQISFVDALWFILFLFLNAIRCLILFSINTINFLPVPFIIFSEIILSMLIFIKINYIYLSVWSHIISLISVLKLISFHFNSKSQNFKHFLYFLIIPKLVYYSSYKQKKVCDMKAVRMKCLLFVVYFILIVFVMDQYAIPSIYKVIHYKSYFYLIENSINLSISIIILFNLFFQLFFNCFLSIVSELTLFDDHTHHKWWNSKSAGEFWVKWNVPVHEYIKFHIYQPLLNRGWKPKISSALCFLISGIAHEYVIIMSRKTISGWFLLGMILQIPFIYISQKVKNSFPGAANTFFWLSFCVIGQPLIVLLYMRSLYIMKV